MPSAKSDTEKIELPLLEVETRPIACSLDSREKALRVKEWHELARAALTRKERIKGGIRAHFEPSAKEAVRELARLEKECCSFFGFRIDVSPQEVILEVTAPEEAEPVLDALFA